MFSGNLFQSSGARVPNACLSTTLAQDWVLSTCMAHMFWRSRLSRVLLVRIDDRSLELVYGCICILSQWSYHLFALAWIASISILAAAASRPVFCILNFKLNYHLLKQRCRFVSLNYYVLWTLTVMRMCVGQQCSLSESWRPTYNNIDIRPIF